MYLFSWALPGPRGWTLDRDGAVFFVKAASSPVDFVVDRCDPPSVRTGERISFELHPPNEHRVQLLEKYECYLASRYVNQTCIPLEQEEEAEERRRTDPIPPDQVNRTCRRLVHKLRRLWSKNDPLLYAIIQLECSSCTANSFDFYHFASELTPCRWRIRRTLLEELERRETFTLSLRNARCLNDDEKTAQSTDGPIRTKNRNPRKVYEYITIPTAALDLFSDVQTLMYIDISLLFHVLRENVIRRHKGKLCRISSFMDQIRSRAHKNR
ncbi:uncharacterized protein LOC143376427 [Andrena cerasifolii]|uniref:uncharacterized protein LOC143376427 n=1 Tax=Andrena cerasifolii TaxID=2819439 RepID=UPI004037D4F4